MPTVGGGFGGALPDGLGSFLSLAQGFLGHPRQWAREMFDRFQVGGLPDIQEGAQSLPYVVGVGPRDRLADRRASQCRRPTDRERVTSPGTADRTSVSPMCATKVPGFT
ncbi:MAG: hypothetical protein WDO73_21065 [Ignavibacteriota bacterium]